MKKQQNPKSPKGNKSFNFKTLVKKTMHTDADGNEIEYPEIVETTNYELLQLLEFNRGICPNHVQTMATSVAELGQVLRDVIVIKHDYSYYVGDGQHLYGALKLAKLPIRCKLVKVDTLEDALKIVAKTNSSSRNWGIKNFIDAWCNFNEDVNVIKNLKATYSLTLTTIAGLLANTTSSRAKQLIASGSFQVVDKEGAVAKIHALNYLYKNTGLVRNQYANIGFINFIGSIGFEKYKKHEAKFIRSVKLRIAEKNLTNKTFGRREDNLDFLNECWLAM